MLVILSVEAALITSRAKKKVVSNTQSPHMRFIRLSLEEAKESYLFLLYLINPNTQILQINS